MGAIILWQFLVSCFTASWMVLLPVLIYYVYKDSIKTHDYWVKMGLPGPKPIPFFGNYLQTLFNDPCQTELMRYKKYGRVYGYFIAKFPMISINEPELIRYVMVKESKNFINRTTTGSNHPILSLFLNELRDQRWTRVRNIVRPYLSVTKVKKLIPTVKSTADQVKRKLEQYSKEKREFDVKELVYMYTFNSFVSSAFSLDTDVFDNPNNPLYQASDNFYQFTYFTIFFYLLAPFWLQHLLKFSIYSNKKCEVYERVFSKLIEDRERVRGTPNEFDDLLQIMVNHKRDGPDFDNFSYNKENKDKAKDLNFDKFITQNEIFGEIIINTTASFEATGVSIIYLVHSLAMFPDVQERLFQEIYDCYKKNNDELKYEDISELTYLNAVFLESQRFHSPCFTSERQAVHDYTFPDTNITVKAGQLVRMSLFAIHHDPEHHPDPYEFKPERFFPENVHKIKPYTFMPFGLGPRACVGMNFGIVQVKMFMAHVCLNYRFVRSAKTENPLRYMTSKLSDITCPHTVICKVEKRQL